MHEPSLAVMETRGPVETTKQDAAKMEGVKPGYTCPITISDEIVGTVSIAGPPKIVERYGLLVQKQAEILLREQSILEMKWRKEQAIRDLAQSVVLYREEDDNEQSLLLHGRELGFKLDRCRIAVVLEIERHTRDDEWALNAVLNRARNFFSNEEHLIASLQNFQIVMFLALQCSRRCGEMETSAIALSRELVKVLDGDGIAVDAAIGLEASSLSKLAESVRTARGAMLVGKALGAGRIYSARDLAAEILISSVPSHKSAGYISETIEALHDGDREGVLRDTFIAWCRLSFSQTEVARSLSIHRNTLQYRLKKIHELTGFDPWSFHDSYNLWSALVLEKLENEKTAQHSV